MLPIIPAYTAPSTSNIANGLVNNASDVVNLITSSNGVNARLAQLTDNVQRELTIANDGISLNPNEDVNIFANATGGAFGVILPPLAGQYKPILFKKHKDISYNGFTVTCTGTDKIQDINSPLVTFTTTTLTIKSPDQYFILTPSTEGWEVTSISDPRVAFQSYLSTAGVTATNTETSLVFNTEDYDYGGYYNNSNGRFTPLVKGVYEVNVSVYFETGSSSELIAILYKNTTPIDQDSFTTTGNATVKVGKKVEMNGTTDYLVVQVRSATATKGILNLGYVTWFQGRWVTHK
jgi:hypothetical protein